MDMQNSTDAARELLSEIYDDALKDTAQETGSILALLPRALKAALYKQETWIMDREYAIKAYQLTRELMLKELAGTDPSKIIPPEPYIATPALEGIAYSIDNESIRTMYAKLLAKAVVEDTKDEVHPAFVQIIKQLSPFDAVLFQSIVATHKDGYIPMICPKITIKGTRSFLPDATPKWFMHPTCDGCDIFKTSVSLVNLARLGLMELMYDRDLTLPDAHRKLLEHPLLKSILDQYENPQMPLQINSTNCVGFVTEFGLNFSKCCF